MTSIKKIQTFIDQIDEWITEHGQDAPLTLGQLKDIFEEIKLRKELKDVQDVFFITQDDADLAEARLSADKFSKWLNERYIVK